MTDELDIRCLSLWQPWATLWRPKESEIVDAIKANAA